MPPAGGGEKKTNNGGELPVGAFVGIGLGAAFALVACVWLILCVVRRRKTAKVEEARVNGGSMHGSDTAELALSTPVCEVGNREAREVKGDMFMPVELGAKARVYQLE